MISVQKISLALRIKTLVLILLVTVTVNFGWQTEATKACQKCVYPTSGLCVACAPSYQPFGAGHNSCVPNQSTCSCMVSGGTCVDRKPLDEGGGGWNDGDGREQIEQLP